MIEVTLTGFKELHIKLDALASSLDVEDILDEAEALLLARIRARFLAEENPDGTPWTPSKAGSIRRSGGYTIRNGRRYTATGTLFETGTLFHSIHAYRKGPGERAIGTDVPYAQYLIDKWTFLGFSEEDLTITEQRVLQRVMETMA